VSEAFLYLDGSTLRLHFAIDAVQSAMDEANPDRLLLLYTQYMMAFLLLNSNPRQICCIGLGGGSIPKYCFRHLPNTQITVVEISREIIALRDTFKVPEDSDRFRVVHADGATFVSSRTRRFDVLLVDAFDLDGQPDPLCSENFYAACHESLTPNGLLVVNLCDDRMEQRISRIERVFGHRVYRLKDESGHNLVVLIGKRNVVLEYALLMDKAHVLEREHELPLQEMAVSLTRPIE
jgi:spermidine synthase